MKDANFAPNMAMVATLPIYTSPASPMFTAFSGSNISVTIPTLQNNIVQQEIAVFQPVAANPPSQNDATAQNICHKAICAAEFFATKPASMSNWGWLCSYLDTAGFPIHLVKRLLDKIFILSRIKGVTFFKITTLAGWLKRTPQTLRTHLNNLQKLGVILISIGEHGRHNYRIAPGFLSCFTRETQAKQIPVHKLHSQNSNHLHTNQERSSAVNAAKSIDCSQSFSPTEETKEIKTLEIICDADDSTPSASENSTEIPAAQPVQDTAVNPIKSLVKAFFTNLTGRFLTKRDQPALEKIIKLPKPYIEQAFKQVADYQTDKGQKIQSLNYILVSAQNLIASNRISPSMARELQIGAHTPEPLQPPQAQAEALACLVAKLQTQVPEVYALAQQVFHQQQYERSGNGFINFVEALQTRLRSIVVVEIPGGFTELADVCWRSQWQGV